MGNLQRQGVFCEMKVRLLKNFRCSRCGGLKMVGSQYYAMQRNWIDVTCVNCSDSKDIEVKKLNVLLRKLGFKQIEEFHVSKQNTAK